jgi:hypothetical protein
MYIYIYYWNKLGGIIAAPWRRNEQIYLAISSFSGCTFPNFWIFLVFLLPQNAVSATNQLLNCLHRHTLETTWYGPHWQLGIRPATVSRRSGRRHVCPGDLRRRGRRQKLTKTTGQDMSLHRQLGHGNVHLGEIGARSLIQFGHANLKRVFKMPSPPGKRRYTKYLQNGEPENCFFGPTERSLASRFSWARNHGFMEQMIKIDKQIHKNPAITVLTHHHINFIIMLLLFSEIRFI